MKHICIFTGVEFSDKNPNAIPISPIARKAICDIIKEDPKMRKEVLSAIVEDDEVLKSVATSILMVRATEVGLNSPGTVAEFFLRLRKQLSKQKTSKANRKIRKNNRKRSKIKDT